MVAPRSVVGGSDNEFCSTTNSLLATWLHKLQACDKAELLLRQVGQPLPAGGCRAVIPPDPGGDLGWQGLSVANMSNRELKKLIFQWRCW